MLQQEEKREEVNITRREVCESLMEEMAVEKQEVMEECKMAEKQRVRWADMEDGQKSEKEKNWPVWSRDRWVVVETETEGLVGQVTAAEEDRPDGEKDEKREEEQQETAEERGQMVEEGYGGRSRRDSERERVIGIAWRKERMNSSSGKNGNGRARVRTMECRIFVWRAGFQGLNQVKMSARHAVRLSRGRVRARPRWVESQ